MKAQKWTLVKHFEGTPKDDDLELTEVELPELKENEFLLEAVYLSVDPYMRPYSRRIMKPPQTMIGEQLAKVVKSRNGEYPIGTVVLSQAGWQSHFISDGKSIPVEPICFDLGATSLSHCLGALGMPGATAYFGVKLLEPKKGDVLVVNGAAGAVGSIVGQLAKIYGCTVIAFVGTDDKLKWCREELGFDHVFNYKTCDFSEAISRVAPDGVDLFFDNIGGDYYIKLINLHMKKYGKVTLCGSIENYNDPVPKLYPATNFSILSKELRVQGIIVNTFKKDWPQAFVEMNKYMQDGRLKTQETTWNGFDKMREAFYGLFTGANTGKALVKA
jgi:prostaglandin reductase 1